VTATDMATNNLFRLNCYGFPKKDWTVDKYGAWLSVQWLITRWPSDWHWHYG